MVLPTAPPPRVVPITVDTPTPPLAPPDPASQARVLALIDHWALGAAATAGPATQKPISTAPGGAAAFQLQGAPVLTATAGVRTVAAVLVTGPGPPARQVINVVAAGDDLLSPTRVVWAGNGAAAAIFFTWRLAGQAVDWQPGVLLDAQGARRGAPLLTLGAAEDLPVWAPGGQYLAYLDAGAAGPRLAIVDGRGALRVAGPATNYECDRCWPDVHWAPAGDRLAYATRQPLPPAPGGTPGAPRGQLTWRLLALDAAAGQVVFDQQGQVVEEAHVLGWRDAGQAQVVLRRPLVPADQITGPAGRWADTSYLLHLDPPPPRLERAPP
ncbi:MAG TPA: hypothetical protein VKY74_09000 [Chloroflexia bacterium]|nr:hypothetical protein [Chloroflexia bacterium]